MKRVLVGLAVAGLAMTEVGTAQAQSAAAANVNSDTSGATGGGASGSPQSGDSGALQEVVVTAERRSEDLQKVALTVTAIDGAAIQQSGDTDLAQVLQDVPSVQIQYQDNVGFGGPPPIAIRGVGTDSGGLAVAMYEDGVLVTQSGAFFYDLNRVEVLRGPQGTLYGQGAVAGAINLVENIPTQQFSGSGQIEYGSYNLIHTTGVFNAPLTDDLSMRVAFNQVKHDGFSTSGFGNDDELNSRVKLLYQPSTDFSLLLGVVAYQSDDSGPIEELLQPNGEVDGWQDPDPPGGNKHLSYKRYYANMVWDAGPFVMTYIPAYQTFFESGTTYGGPGKISDHQPENNTQTQELRISNPDGSPFQWVGGVYYYRFLWNSAFDGSIIASGTLPNATYLDAINIAQQESDTNTAVFGEVTFPLTDAIRLTGGVRETWTRIPYEEQDDIFGGATDYESLTNYKHFDWKTRVEYDLTAANLVYALVSTGSRSGGPESNGVVYGPESMKAFEIGSKNRFFDNRVQLNVSGYYYNYAGFQESVTLTAPNDPSVIIGEGVATVPARFGGIELESIFQLTPNDQLSLSPSFEKGHYAGNYASAGVVNLTDGKTPTHMPEWMLSGSYSHRFDLPNGKALTVMADVHYQGMQLNAFNTTYFNSEPGANDYITGAYALSDASLTYGPRDGQYSISAYVKNLTNVEYKYDVLPAPAGTAAYVNNPRTFGIILSAKF